MPLFEHMLSKKCIDPKGGVKDAPSANLDVSITSSQGYMLKPTSLELIKQDIMKYVGGNGATIKMAAWKLDQLQYVKAHSCVANATKLAQLEKLTNQLQLANSLAVIERSDTATAKKKKPSLLPIALRWHLWRLELAEKDGHMIRLTKKDISALLFVHFLVDMDKLKHKKPEVVTKLTGCMVNDPEKLPLPADSILV